MLNANTGSWNTLWDAVNLPEYVNQYQEPVSLDLSQFQGNDIRLRFRGYNADMDVLTYSWFIDNVKVVATDTIPSGVNEPLVDQVNLFPNPVKDQLHIDSKAKIRRMEIMAVNGTIIEDRRIDDYVINYGLKGYSEGVYFIRLITDEGVITKKVIVR